MLDLKIVMKTLSDYYSKKLTKAEIGIYKTLLSAYPIEIVSQAVNLHMVDPERGRFFPKVADLVAKMPAQKGNHVGADEAWSLALRSMDEADSVTLTQQIMDARQIALPVFNSGDEVGARMAFKDSYKRIVSESQEPPTWFLSIGHDPELRDREREKSVNAGLLPAPKHDPLMLDGETEKGHPEGSARVRNEVQKILAKLQIQDDENEAHRESVIAAQRAAEEVRKQELQDQANQLIEKQNQDSA